MGAKGIRIEEPGDVREGLAEALAYKDGPVVSCICIHKRNLLKGGVVIASYNDHVRLLFSRASWLVQHHRVYPGLGSRHCHAINFTNGELPANVDFSGRGERI